MFATGGLFGSANIVERNMRKKMMDERCSGFVMELQDRGFSRTWNEQRLIPFWLRPGYTPTINKGKCRSCKRTGMKKFGSSYDCSFCQKKLIKIDTDKELRKKRHKLMCDVIDRSCEKSL